VHHGRDDIADYFEDDPPPTICSIPVRNERLIALCVYRVSHSKVGSIALWSIGPNTRCVPLLVAARRGVGIRSRSDYDLKI
jgi:hypothetical protein